jgi:hypothetical protein
VFVEVREEDGTFWDTLGHLPTQPATNPSPKQRKQLKTSLIKNAFGGLLLLLHTFQKIQLKSTSILPNDLAISLFAFCCQGQVWQNYQAKKDKTSNILRSSQTLFLHNLYAIRINPK